MTALDFYKETLKDRGFNKSQVDELTNHKDLPWIKFAEDYCKKKLKEGGYSEKDMDSSYDKGYIDGVNKVVEPSNN